MPVSFEGGPECTPVTPVVTPVETPAPQLRTGTTEVYGGITERRSLSKTVRSQTFRLGSPSLCGITAFTLSTIGAASYFLARQWDEGCIHPCILALPAVSLVLCALAIGSYVSVAFGQPRSMQLHAHGLMLFMLLFEECAAVAKEAFLCENAAVPSVITFLVQYETGTARHLILIWLVMIKVSALGSSPQGRGRLCPPGRRCCRGGRALEPGPWCLLLLQLFAGVLVFNPIVGVYRVVMIARGVPLKTVMLLRPSPRDADGGADGGGGGLDGAALGLFLTAAVAYGGAALLVLAFCGLMLATCLTVRRTLAQLAQRSVSEESFRLVRCTLYMHTAGILVSLLTANFVLVLLIAQAALELPAQSLWHSLRLLGEVVDRIGDAVGVILLSGIVGLLLPRGGGGGGGRGPAFGRPEDDDVRAYIRGVLQSAVSTSRAESAFEGRVLGGSVSCVASFPGKYLEDWNSLTWQCERDEVSSACVFLPRSDPLQRFGKHAANPETPGFCWCYSLYGQTKPWGCVWFQVWQQNIREAASLGLELVVVYFDGQVGLGKVPWHRLPGNDLWDGVGLGGSQKAEVAFLESRGHRFVEEDVTSWRLRMSEGP